jgi:hypothetical protein
MFATTMGMVRFACWSAATAALLYVTIASGLELDQLPGERRQPVGSSLPPTVIDQNILALYIAEFVKALPEGFEKEGAGGSGDGPQVTYPWDLRRLLCVRDERRSDEADSENDHESDQPHEHLVKDGWREYS